MGNVVIVAIPDENDRVWKISSEKVPHLTVLFLGEEGNVTNLDQIMLFVEHAASTSLKRFYLPVDRRGELGADQADVLFFKKNRYDFKAVRDFRSLLLKDPNIKTAYDSTTQFEAPKEVGVPGQSWIPHLTLGYPATPAKPDEQDFGFYSVNFNKIAVWTGDFEGPEFLLKDYGEEFDEMDIPMDVTMSELAHYGTKGMKWGVRKQEVGKGGHIRISNRTNVAGVSTASGAAIVGVALVVPGVGGLASFLHPRVRREWKASSDHNKLVRQDKKWKKRIDKSKKDVEVHNTAADEINKKIGDFNNDKRWKDATGKDIDLASNPTKQKEYDDAAMKELLNPAYANAAVKVYGSKSPSERYTFEIKDAAKGELKMTDALAERRKAQLAGAKHAATDEDDLIEDVVVPFKISRDANGYILGFELEDQEEVMAQTADLGVEFLAHFGVKGMRWGHRKAELGGVGRSVGTAAKSAGGKVGKAASATARFAGDVSFENRAEDGRAREAIISEAHKPFKRTDLPAVKARHGDYAKLTNRVKKPFSKEAKAYRKDARETYVKRLETTANSMKNVSGDRQYTIRERGLDLPARGGPLPKSKTYWDVSTRRVKHAVTDDFTTLEVIMDDEGYITDLKKVETELAQSVSDVGAAFVLEHYGVKGMRWGHRRAAPEAVGPSATSVVPHGTRRKTKIKVAGGENHPAHTDAVKVAQAKAKLQKSGTAALSNKELQELQNRLNLERNVKQLVGSTTTTGRGRKFVKGLTGFNKEVNEAVGTGLQSERLIRQVRR